MAIYLHLDELGHPCIVLYGDRLKKRRLKMGLTQAQIAEQSGVTASHISIIERGRANPTFDVMARLAEAVGLEVWAMIRPE